MSSLFADDNDPVRLTTEEILTLTEDEERDPTPEEWLNAAFFDGETLLLIDGNGEVVGEHGAPDQTAEIMDIIGWLGPRYQHACAQLKGKKTERDALIAAINAQYDPQIKRLEGRVAWLGMQYRDKLLEYTKTLIAAANGKTKTFRVGLLKLALRTRPGKLEVTDEATALQWAKLACPNAVEMKERLFVSRIPKEMELPPNASGMVRIPSSEVFTME